MCSHNVSALELICFYGGAGDAGQQNDSFLSSAREKDQVNSYFYYATAFATVSLLYLCIAALIYVCRFVMAWTLIRRVHEMDQAFVQRTRRSFRRASSLVNLDSMKQTTCPVCLGDFHENQNVTDCDGCRTWFHNDCVFEWLDYSYSCPCCRKDLVKRQQEYNWLADLSLFLGYSR
jgi:hypothetical protein